ncbi:MAG: phosphate-binding protein, partial [Gammaproteobacteria bacterium]|nr:phosphate-binding protein [Gammaproteobacteria bacterium]
GYRTSGVNAIPISKGEGSPYVEATPENAVSGKYPLSRFLYVYVNKAPNKPLAPLDREFIRMVLSKTGQKVVEKDGYVALPTKVVNKYLKELK